MINTIEVYIIDVARESSFEQPSHSFIRGMCMDIRTHSGMSKGT